MDTVDLDRWKVRLGFARLGFAGLACAAAACGGDSEATQASSVSASAMCEVLKTLREDCWACHGTTLHGSAPMSLTSRAQLVAPSLVDPSKTNAERALVRVQSPQSPMPPGKALVVHAEEVANLAAWIAAGYPEASCDVPDPYVAAPTCTSGVQLGDSQAEGEDMHPGRVCNSCHERANAEEGGDAPIFTAGGTIFPSAHEPDDCRATGSEGAKVELTDAAGKVVTLEANESGNFLTTEPLSLPYSVRILFEGRERRMATHQDKPMCNECHTQAGSNGAPGRILLP